MSFDTKTRGVGCLVVLMDGKKKKEEESTCKIGTIL